MTGQDLLYALKATGTGERKLSHVRDILERDRGADAGFIYESLRDELGSGHGTVLKARALINGTYRTPVPDPIPMDDRHLFQKEMFGQFTQFASILTAATLGKGQIVVPPLPTTTGPEPTRDPEVVAGEKIVAAVSAQAEKMPPPVDAEKVAGEKIVAAIEAKPLPPGIRETPVGGKVDLGPKPTQPKQQPQNVRK